MDRRGRMRFDLNAPVTYTWPNPAGAPLRAAGRTRDISESGLFVIADSLPPLESRVELEVSFSFKDKSQVKIRAQGKVLRVDATLHGFAAITTEPVLVRAPETAADPKILGPSV